MSKHAAGSTRFGLGSVTHGLFLAALIDTVTRDAAICSVGYLRLFEGASAGFVRLFNFDHCAGLGKSKQGSI
jgi:hypothetical protein